MGGSTGTSTLVDDGPGGSDVSLSGSARGQGGAPNLGDTEGARNTACDVDIHPNAALVRSCVLGNACDPLVPSLSLSRCITYDTPRDCIKQATTCADVVACNKRSWEKDSACGDGEVGWKCSGARAIQCSDEQPWSVDCGELGGTCSLYSGSDTDTVWPCWQQSPGTCDAPGGRFSCSGSTRYTCRDGRTFGVDCAKVGLSCLETIPGQAYCGTEQTACDAPSTSSCFDNSVVLCSTAGYAFTYDCTRGDSECETDGALSWSCKAPGCTPEAGLRCQEECGSASVMKVCVGGARYEIDCADYGFAACVLYRDPIDDSTYVGCR